MASTRRPSRQAPGCWPSDWRSPFPERLSSPDSRHAYGQPARLCEAGPLKGRTLPASSAAVCSRGPACICRRALDAAQRRGCPANGRVLQKADTNNRRKPGRHRDRRLDPVGARDWRASAHGDSCEPAARSARRRHRPRRRTGIRRPICVSKLHAAGLVARRARGRARESDPTANGGETAGADLSVGLYWSADSGYACM